MPRQWVMQDEGRRVGTKDRGVARVRRGSNLRLGQSFTQAKLDQVGLLCGPDLYEDWLV